MYMSEYHPGLGSLRRRLRKIGKVAAHVGAAVATGGASLAVTAAMHNAKKQRQAQAAAAAQEQALVASITTLPAPSIAPVVNTPSAGGVMPVSIAPAATPPQQQFLTQPGGPGESSGQFMTVEGGRPAWLMPAMIGGGVLLAMTMMRGGSR